MPIVIRSRREGFRRCGIAHSVAPTTYPDNQFGASQLDALRSEPMLIVEEAVVGDEEKSDAGAGKTPATPRKTTPAAPASSPAPASEKSDASAGDQLDTASEKPEPTAGKAPAAPRKSTKGK